MDIQILQSGYLCSCCILMILTMFQFLFNYFDHLNKLTGIKHISMNRLLYILNMLVVIMYFFAK